MPKNPQAFPNNFADESAQGMTLRDYFAANAMAAIIQLASTGAISKVAEQDGISRLKAVAIASYEAADAMLAEREKEPR